MDPGEHLSANPFDDPALSLERLRRRTSAKWRDYPDDVLPLWIAEMDVAVAPPVVAAVQEALAHGDTGYPAATSHAYGAALAAFAADRWGWSFEPATAVQVTDVMTGILEIIRVVGRGDEAIVVTPPVYPPFFAVAQTLGRSVVTAPLTPDGRLNPESLEAAFVRVCRSNPGGFLLLANPHNPTGTVPTRAELEAVVGLARRYNIRVIADEIHAPLVMPDAVFTPYHSVPGTAPDFVVSAASKGWNLAGFKAALIVPGQDAASDLAYLAEREGNQPGHIALIAHTAALTHGRPWLDTVVAGIDANRRALSALLETHLPDAGYRPPEGTYLAWIDCRALGLGNDPAAVFLAQGRVALSSGVSFGAGGTEHVRLNLATSPAILAEAVRRMGAVASRDGNARRQAGT